MKVLFDTTVLVASFLKSHEFHSQAAAWLLKVHAGSIEMVVSAHTLAELYSSLTRLPKGYRIPAHEVWQMIETDLLQHAAVRTLRASQYAKLIKRLSTENLTGGIVYDAIIAEVAWISKVDVLLTLNTPHFERVMRSDGPRIVTPVESTPAEVIKKLKGN